MKRSDLDLDNVPEDETNDINALLDDIETRVGNIKDKMEFSNYQRIEDFNGMASMMEEVHTAHGWLEKLVGDLY